MVLWLCLAIYVAFSVSQEYRGGRRNRLDGRRNRQMGVFRFLDVGVFFHLFGKNSAWGGAPGLSFGLSILIFYEETDGSDGVLEQRGADGKIEIRKAVENPKHVSTTL